MNTTDRPISLSSAGVVDSAAPGAASPRRVLLIGPPDAACAAARILLPLANQRRANVLGVVTLSPMHSPTVRDFADPTSPTLPWLGVIDDLASIQSQADADAAVVCIPEAFSRIAQRVRASLAALRLPSTFLPTPEDLLAPSAPAAAGAPRADGQAVAPGNLPPLEKTFDPSFLIGRPPREADHEALARANRLLRGKRVLITGAGGSIGSELALAVASHEPELLILMERAENSLFEIDRRLAERFPRLARKSMLHDVVEAESTLEWLRQLRPHVVFHAAAHKHVTVMEDHPSHAINNNLFGAKSIADASLAAGVGRFVMISTDKAVNPRSVMGATKRFAELYVRSLNRPGSPSRFSMVRFGNVLGSACSVLPIWSRQIADASPLTVTHPEMTRYFMTIPEAARLVIQAGALDPEEARGADIFVLDMGAPVRIIELAERFARAHNLSPRIINRETDGAMAAGAPRPGASHPGALPGALPGAIDIVFTGPRPGEKLHEELAHASEELRPTPAEGVLAWAGVATDSADVRALVETLGKARWSADRDEVVACIARFAPGVAASLREPKVLGPSIGVAALQPQDLRPTTPQQGGRDLSAA